MPSEWLPEVWGLDGEPEFASMEQAKETIGAVMAHYNRVAENLASRRKPYEIVLEQAVVKVGADALVKYVCSKAVFSQLCHKTVFKHSVLGYCVEHSVLR